MPIPSHMGPYGGTDLHFCSAQRDNSLRCETMYTKLLHYMVRLITTEFSPVSNNTAWW